MKLKKIPRILVVMLMKRYLLLFSVFFVLSPVHSTESAVKTVSKSKTEKVINITAKGVDARTLLYDLFTQSSNEFVLEDLPHTIIYLSLKEVKFKKALNIVSRLANLTYRIEDGIYYIRKKTDEEILKDKERVKEKKKTESEDTAEKDSKEKSSDIKGSPKDSKIEDPAIEFDEEEALPPVPDFPEIDEKLVDKKKATSDLPEIPIPDSEKHENLDSIESQADNTVIQLHPKNNARSKVSKAVEEIKKTEKKIQDKGKITNAQLRKAVTLKMNKVQLTEVFAAISKQAKVAIEVSPEVKNVRMDAHILRKRLVDALQLICGRLNLKYHLTDNKSILIYSPSKSVKKQPVKKQPVKKRRVTKKKK